MKLINETTQNFLTTNISKLAEEIIGWNDTGILNGGSSGLLRKLANMLVENSKDSIDYSQCLKIAKQLVEQECLKIVSSIK